MERISGTRELACPLCGGSVDARGCANCHLSLSEVRRYGRAARSGAWGKAVWTRFIGLVAYAGVVAWSWWFMPTVFLFVLPGAIVGAYLHVLRGRVITGALVCFAIVVVVPLLLVAAGLTGVFADVTGGH
jgi:hypothetical protein